MNLCRCEKGHFYDKEKYATCPHCAGGSAADNSLTAAFTEDVTTPVSRPASVESIPNFPPAPENSTEQYDPLDLPLPPQSADEPTEALYTAQPDSPTVPLSIIPKTLPMPEGRDGDDNDHTIGIYDDFFTSASPVESAEVHRQSKNSGKNKVSTPCVGWLVALGGEHIGTDFRLKVGKNFIGRSSQMDIALTDDKSVSRERHGIVVYEPKAHLYLVQPGESSSLVYRNDEVVLTPVKLEPYDVITVGDVNLLFMPLCGTRFNWGELFKQMREEKD